jgi:hypothetical protein
MSKKAPLFRGNKLLVFCQQLKQNQQTISSSFGSYTVPQNAVKCCIDLATDLIVKLGISQLGFGNAK